MSAVRGAVVTVFPVSEQGTVLRAPERRWTRLTCSRCRYMQGRPGLPQPGDLDRPCQLCGAELGAVTVYAVARVRPKAAGPGPFVR